MNLSEQFGLKGTEGYSVIEDKPYGFSPWYYITYPGYAFLPVKRIFPNVLNRSFKLTKIH